MNDVRYIPDSDLQDNSTVCTTYIPGINEYHEALGGLWVVFVVVGCITCLALYCLFLEQVFESLKNAHVGFRNSLVWIASVYPFMTLMTIVGFSIPRSQQVCYTVKVLYMMIGISKFTDLTVLMYGSEEVMLWTLRESTLNIGVGPLCCFFCCIPRLNISKIRLRLILAGVRQLPYTQCFFLVMIMILQSANQVVIGSLDPRGSYLWLNIFSVSTSLMGVYCLNIISNVSKNHLKHYYYNQMSFVMKALIIVTKMQSLIFNVLAYYQIFPCIPPISHYVYRQTVGNFFYLFEMFVFGLYSYKIYRQVTFSTANPCVVRTDPRGNLRPFHPAYLPSLSSHVEEYDYGLGYPADANFIDNVDEFDEAGFVEGVNGAIARGREQYDFSEATLVIENGSPEERYTGMEREREREGAVVLSSGYETFA